MAYRLILAERRENAKGTSKDVGENVFLTDVPRACKVYVFYYAGSMPNTAMEARLRKLGEAAGKNLFINIGKLNDPQHDRIVSRFGISKYPVIVVTAIGALAAPARNDVSTYARLDSTHLLGSPDQATAVVEELFNLFLQGKVSEAISRAKWREHAQLAKQLSSFFLDALKALGKFVAERDITISVIKGTFELKRSKA